MRQGEEHRPDDDADGPVDRVAEQEVLQHPLIAEHVDQRDARQQRRHQDRHHDHQPERALEGMRCGHRIGEAEGQEQREDVLIEAM
jgi:hypothetical protein